MNSVKFRKSFIFKLFILVAAVQFLMVVSLGVYFIRQVSANTHARTVRSNLESLRSVSEYIEFSFASFVHNMTLLASMPAITTFDPIASDEILKSYVVSSVFVADEKVTVVDNTNSIVADNAIFLSGVGRDTIITDYLGLADPRRPYISDVKWENNVPYKEVVVSVQNFAVGYGALVAEFSLRRLKDFITDTRIGESGYAFITDGNGQLLAHRERGLVANRTHISGLGFPEDFDVRYSIVGGSGSGKYKLKSDAEYLVSHSYIKDLGIAVFVLQPAEEIRGLVRDVQLGIVLTLLTTVLLSISMTMYFSGKLVKPLNLLTSRMILVKEGNLETSSGIVKRTDEIGVLAEVFDLMRESLKKYIKALNDKISDLKKIHESLGTVIASREENELINRYLHIVLEVFDSDFSSICRFSKDNKIEYSDKIVKTGFFLPITEEEISEINQVIAENTAVMNKSKAYTKPDMSVLSIPLAINNRVYGVINSIKFVKDYYKDDIIETAEIFGNQITIGLENIRLYREEKSKMMLEIELENAKIIQEAIFPKECFGNEWLRLVFGFKAAGQLNGDWFKYFYDKQNDSFYYMIGDVTGHGVGAALMTGTVNTFVKMLEYQYAETPYRKDLSVVMKDLNRLIQDTSSHLNMTFIIARIDRKDGRIELCNAGHNHAILFRREVGGVMYHTLYNQNYRLGESYDVDFFSDSFEIRKGDRILFYTDGIIEWVDKNGRQWGKKNLIKMFVSEFGNDIDIIKDSISKEILSKVDDPKNLKDDYTFTIVEIDC